MKPEQQLNEADYLTEEQLILSDKRYEAYERSGLQPWNVEDGTLLFDLEPELLDTEQLEHLAAGSMKRKPEYHVTIIGRPAGKEIVKAIRVLPENEQATALDDIQKIIGTLGREWQVDPRIYQITKHYPVGSNPEKEPAETRTSYIQMVNFKGLAEVYQRLNARLGLQLEPPPTHITLMTGSTNPAHMTEGIGVPTKEVLKAVQPRQVWPVEGEIVDDKK